MDVWFMVAVWFIASLNLAVAIEYVKIITNKNAEPRFHTKECAIIIACIIAAGIAVGAFIDGLGVL